MLQITEMLLTNHNRPKLKLKGVKAIVIHYTANFSAGSTARANRNYFNTTDRACSAQYIVDDHSIILCVPEDELAYAVGANTYTQYGESLKDGVYSPNYFTISIEMCVNIDGDYNKTYQNTIELCADLLKRHNLSLDNLVMHNHITGKNCHAWMVERPELWTKFKQDVANIMNVKVEIKTVPQAPSIRTLKRGCQGEDVKDLQVKLNSLEYSCGTPDGIFGGKTDVATRKLQQDNKLSVDGIVGSVTMGKINELIARKNTVVEKPKPQINQRVLAYQKAFNKMGLGHIDEDGILGNETLGSLSKLPLIKLGSYNPTVGFVQGVVGTTQDCRFGNGTLSYVQGYQSRNGLVADGVVGQATLKYMLTH